MPFDLSVRAPVPPRGSLGNQSPAYQVLGNGEGSAPGSDDGEEPKRKRKRGQPTPASSSKRAPPARLELPRAATMHGTPTFNTTSTDPHLHGLKSGYSAAGPPAPPSHATPFTVHPGYPTHMAAYQMPAGPASAPAYYQSTPSSGGGGSWPWHDPSYSASQQPAPHPTGTEPSSPAAFFSARPPPQHSQAGDGQYLPDPAPQQPVPHPTFAPLAHDVFHSRPASAASIGRPSSAQPTPAAEPESVAA